MQLPAAQTSLEPHPHRVDPTGPPAVREPERLSNDGSRLASEPGQAQRPSVTAARTPGPESNKLPNTSRRSKTAERWTLTHNDGMRLGRCGFFNAAMARRPAGAAPQEALRTWLPNARCARLRSTDRFLARHQRRATRDIMQLATAELKKLDLSTAVSQTVDGNLDRFPSLILNRCFASSKGKVASDLVAQAEIGFLTPVETLAMPRRGFGPRPVTVLPTTSQALYTSLVAAIAPSLPAPSRTPDNWKQFTEFGQPASATAAEYVVSFDIAACYEFIEHAILKLELVKQSMLPHRAASICGLLGDIFTRGRGLPQLMQASDIISDVYLSAFERNVAQKGFTLMRYADDFKIVADSWGSAMAAIEAAADSARQFGLILASDKTSVHKRSTLERLQEERESFLDGYFSKAQQELTEIDTVTLDEYAGGTSVIFIEPTEHDTVMTAMRTLLEDWIESTRSEGPHDSGVHVGFVPSALNYLASDKERVPDEWLEELVFRLPRRLELVCQYLLARPIAESCENWKTLAKLAAMERQSPWAKTWLLHCAEQQTVAANPPSEESVENWARRQLLDRHEVVRSESAWFLAGRTPLEEDALGQTYASATSITRGAVAASVGRRGFAATSPLMKAVKGDSALMSDCLQWGSTP